MSMPIVATGKFNLWDMVVLLCLVASSKHHSLEGREHGRTIPLAVIGGAFAALALPPLWPHGFRTTKTHKGRLAERDWLTTPALLRQVGPDSDQPINFDTYYYAIRSNGGENSGCCKRGILPSRSCSVCYEKGFRPEHTGRGNGHVLGWQSHAVALR